MSTSYWYNSIRQLKHIYACWCVELEYRIKLTDEYACVYMVLCESEGFGRVEFKSVRETEKWDRVFWKVRQVLQSVSFGFLRKTRVVVKCFVSGGYERVNGINNTFVDSSTLA